MIAIENPVAFAQERIWFLQKLDPDDRSYQFQATLTFDGALNVGALERALGAIVSRHEIYRASFPGVDGGPVQRIEPGAAAAFAFVDLGSAGDPDEAERRAIAAAFAASFDVERLPLVRWTLLRTRADRHVLVHVEHHLVHDGWSFNLFLDELAEFYRAFAAGAEARLADAPKFTDFARRQRRLAAAPAAAEQLAYWARTLAGAPALLNLPLDRGRPPVQTHTGDAIVRELPRATLAQIERLSRRCGATPFMTMFAAFCVLLGRYSGEMDICVGTGIAGRDTPELERLIGMVVNNLVLRVDLTGDPPFTDLLERVKTVALDAYANGSTPLERVVEAVAPRRDPSFNPLFCVLFSFHDSPAPVLDFGGLAVTLDQTADNASAKMDLNVVAIPHAGGMTLKWEYNSDLFERASMERMFDHFAALVARIVDEPERRISRYELMREPERRLVLEEFAQNPQPFPRDASIAAVFQAAAARTPDACALHTADESVTYRELDERSNRLARFMRDRGLRAHDRVALLAERSTAAVTAMLAVLKAGAAYVPLDARYPAERIAWILADAAVSLTLAHGALRELLPPQAAVVELDRGAGEIAGASSAPLIEPQSPEALAYVMYTSGSTGRPKGVCVSQRNVVRLVTGGGPGRIQADDMVLQYAAYAFDACTYEVWGALLNGAALAIPAGGVLSLAELGEALARARVTVAFLTTPLFHQMVESRLEDLQPLRLLVAGGDVLSPSHARRFVERFDAALLNGYGPTENTTFTTMYAVPRDIGAVKTISIGRPIPNTSVYLLDANRAPVPIGIPGELWTGGDGVARGYLNAPELTAQRFVDDPFSAQPGAMLYWTGDRARWRADGTLEFLGRTDDQVKVRGFRVELGEIEATLLAHPDVREAAVAIAGAIAEERTLVAHVVLASDATTDGTALRRFVAGRLPDFAVPARIAVLDTLPHSAGGKIDRTALLWREPGAAAPAAAADEHPRDGVETQLAAIWAALLQRPRVGRHDDFFECGGHSLMGMRLLARVNEAFDIEVSLRALFEHRTLAALAAVIAAAPRVVRPVPIDVSALSDAEIDALLDGEFADIKSGLE